jgi:hypothetical protein
MPIYDLLSHIECHPCTGYPVEAVSALISLQKWDPRDVAKPIVAKDILHHPATFPILYFAHDIVSKNAERLGRKPIRLAPKRAYSSY